MITLFLHNLNYVKTLQGDLSMPRIVDHQERKAMIASAACAAIARRGLEAVTLADVSKEADCSTGTITHYFADKNEVLVAALDHAIETMNSRMERKLRQDPEDIIGFLSEALPLSRCGRDETKVWFCFWSRAMHDSELGLMQRSMHCRWRGKVDRLLEGMVKRGEICVNCGAEDEAEALCALINGIGLRATLDPENWPAKRQVKTLEDHLAHLAPKASVH